MTEKRIKQEVIDELMKQYSGPEDFQALFTALKKAVMERALNAELSAHLGYEKARTSLLESRTIAMARAARRCWASRDRCGWRFLEIATVRSIPN